MKNINLGCHAKDLVDYCELRSVTVTSCSIFPSKKVYGTAAARLVVATADADKALEKDFWPGDIQARH